MASTTKTVKFTADFSVVDASNTSSPRKVIKDLNLTVTQVQSSDPLCIAASTTDFEVPFAGITAAKRIYIETDQEVTIKFNTITAPGFAWQGAGVVPSGSTGISALYISTGGTVTNVSVVVAGD